MREFCLDNEIVYQGFSLLTANPQFVESEKVRDIAGKWGMTPEQVTFRFCIELGILPLTGTSDPRHMEEDLASWKIELTENEVASLADIGE